ncbi:MAG TPA: hypothetical protein VFZ53_25250 [Polyangiaceae bacterium]
MTSSFALGCESAATRVCSNEYAASQQKVLAVDAKSAESVRTSLEAVKTALAACKSANRNQEVDNLVKARNELGAQLDALDRRAKRKPRRDLSQDELAKLEKEGDPSCPKGQTFRLENKKEVKCTGPQLVEMARADVKNYYEERGYRVKETPPNGVIIERGAEKYTFTYPSSGAADRPSCVVLVPPPGMPWKEALSRATGKHPEKLEPKGAITASQGELPYTVDEKNVVIRIGACPN